MKNIRLPKKPELIVEQIKEDQIILNGAGQFPKEVIIQSSFGGCRKYRLERTRRGNYILK